MFKRTLMLIGCLLLSACAEGNVADVIARDAAKSVVRPIIVENLPGVPPDLVTDCIIDNASAAEIITLARAATSKQVSQDTIDTVVGIARRPEVIQCAADEGLSALLNAAA